MTADLWALYRMMLKSRLFEEAVGKLWQEGLISGEMHLGTGEEGIVAGVLAHVREGDALALDHRGSAALLLRGVDPVLDAARDAGSRDGLCGGMGGHMHLFSKEHLAATTGIVGAGGTGGCRLRAGGADAAPGRHCDHLLRGGRDEPGHAAGSAEPGRGVEPAGAVRLQG